MALEQRYINTASTPGGDGTTNAITGANRAYASASEWETAEQKDLVAAGNNHVVNATGISADNTALIISGWTTSATNNIVFNGESNGIWDTSKYRITSTDWDATVQILTGFVEFNNVSVDNTGTGGGSYAGVYIGLTSGDVTVDSCCIRKSVANAATTTQGITVVSSATGAVSLLNNIIYDYHRGISASTGTNSEFNIYNNTIFVSGDVGIGLSLWGATDTLSCINNIIQNATATDFSIVSTATTQNIDYNLSQDATATGTNSVVNTLLTFSDKAGKDFHLAGSDTAAINAGSDLSSDTYFAFNYDIDGDIRSTWDIGADEYTVAGASITASDATATRGQTNYNFTLSGGDATPGTATLSDGTNTAPITITTYNPNGVCTATIPSDIAIMYDTAAVLTFTDATSGTPTAIVDFQPEAGFSYRNIIDVTNVGTSASILFGYNGAAPTINMQVLFTPLTNVTSKAFNVKDTTAWSNTPVVTQTETVQIQAISTDGSQGSVQTFTLNVGGGGSYLGNENLVSTLNKSLVQTLVKKLI